MSKLLSALTLMVIAPATLAWAQLSEPNEAGVAMGHLHYQVRDVEANKQFWVDLGGEATSLGPIEIVRFPDALVLLTEGESSGGTEGSIINHVAFRVQSLEGVEASGLEIERLEGFQGIASIFTPEGERIELFDETATNLTFTQDDGFDDPVANRHNESITEPIIAHHIHLYVPEGSEVEAKNWYASMFGGTPGMRWRYNATDLPGINFNFSISEEVLAPTQGRMLDHIGFEVRDLETFTRELEARGVDFDVPYTKGPSGFGSAFLTDPWGTYIELTEGLDGL